MLRNQFDGLLLLSRRGIVIGIDQNIRIEKATNAHGYRLD